MSSHKQGPGRLFGPHDLHIKGIDLAPSTIRRWVAEGKFPPPIRLSLKRPVWREIDLDRWIAKLPREGK
jgi:predicted DNA-binding transcriptional regulator AlpA